MCSQVRAPMIPMNCNGSQVIARHRGQAPGAEFTDCEASTGHGVVEGARLGCWPRQPSPSAIRTC